VQGEYTSHEVDVQHLRNEKQMIPFKCATCTQEFTKSKDLMDHIKNKRCPGRKQ
jgi:DNA-directed RNA polymerase subunit RPC12/RpoP